MTPEHIQALSDDGVEERQREAEQRFRLRRASGYVTDVDRILDSYAGEELDATWATGEDDYRRVVECEICLQPSHTNWCWKCRGDVSA